MNDWTVKLLCLSKDFKNSKVVPSAVHFAFQIIFFLTINFVLFILIIEIINLWFCHVSFHTYYLIYVCSCVCVKLIYCMYIWCTFVLCYCIFVTMPMKCWIMINVLVLAIKPKSFCVLFRNIWGSSDYYQPWTRRKRLEQSGKEM